MTTPTELIAEQCIGVKSSVGRDRQWLTQRLFDRETGPPPQGTPRLFEGRPSTNRAGRQRSSREERPKPYTTIAWVLICSRTLGCLLDGVEHQEFPAVQGRQQLIVLQVAPLKISIRHRVGGVVAPARLPRKSCLCLRRWFPPLPIGRAALAVVLS
jgi:hypothetical protein